jgi:hypothetical protein
MAVWGQGVAMVLRWEQATGPRAGNAHCDLRDEPCGGSWTGVQPRISLNPLLLASLCHHKSAAGGEAKSSYCSMSSLSWRWMPGCLSGQSGNCREQDNLDSICRGSFSEVSSCNVVGSKAGEDPNPTLMENRPTAERMGPSPGPAVGPFSAAPPRPNVNLKLSGTTYIEFRKPAWQKLDHDRQTIIR